MFENQKAQGMSIEEADKSENFYVGTKQKSNILEYGMKKELFWFSNVNDIQGKCLAFAGVDDLVYQNGRRTEPHKINPEGVGHIRNKLPGCSKCKEMIFKFGACKQKKQVLIKRQIKIKFQS
jgi:hypothetical protein